MFSPNFYTSMYLLFSGYITVEYQNSGSNKFAKLSYAIPTQRLVHTILLGQEISFEINRGQIPMMTRNKPWDYLCVGIWVKRHVAQS